jgi:hypothetical protein
MPIQSRDSRTNPKTCGQEKRPLASEWPKSREETPKEGSNSATRYCTASICIASQRKSSAFAEFAMQFAHAETAKLQAEIQ